MQDTNWLNEQAALSLERLMPRIAPLLDNAEDRDIFFTRLTDQFPRLFRLLFQLYGDQYDFFYHLEQLLNLSADIFMQRPESLKSLDSEREQNPLWFHSEKMMGAVCYVDLFARDLEGVRQHIPYFKELGITYLHLMPLFATPDENNDGGYAVSDYRSVRQALGTMDDLSRLTDELRAEGISLVLDFIFNHTSEEHTWAKYALEGSLAYQNFYYLFPDRTLPDQYEENLREIFPEQAPGNFTYIPEMDKWVWTSFYNFQWDLNYKNPAVFNAMLGEMLFLANQGVEVLRLDAVAFIWKQMGTSCESLPQAHWIIQAYNALVRIVAPALYFKSEAIVHPDDVMSYISWEEAPISYNPTLMALLWESLATRRVELLRQSMAKRFELPQSCAWVNYVRVHDDIGWTFADEDAAEVWINGYDHRQFLNRFYTGDFPGSFAAGLPFNFNPKTGDMRISGTAASLAGLEKAIRLEDEYAQTLAIVRLLLIYSVILSVGGIPLLYLGDELATLNDYSYRDNPYKKDDSRWVHRPSFNWERAIKDRANSDTLTGRLFQQLQNLINIRKQSPVFAGNKTLFFDTGNPHVLGYIHNRQLLVLCNFSEQHQVVVQDILRAYIPSNGQPFDLVTNELIIEQPEHVLKPYQFYWWLYQ